MLYGNIHVYSKDDAFTSPFPMLKETCLIGYSVDCDIRINIKHESPQHIRLSYSPVDNSIYIESIFPSSSSSSSPSTSLLPITVTNINDLGRSVVLDTGVKHKLHHGDMWELQGRRFRFDYNSLTAGGDVPSIPVLPDTPKRSVTEVFGLPREVNERAPLINSPFRMVSADGSTASYSTNIAEKSASDKLHEPSTAKDELREFRAEAQKSQVREPFSLAQKTELPSIGTFIKEQQQPLSIFSAATEIDPFSAKISSASETLNVTSKPERTFDLFQTTLKQPSLQMQPVQTQPSPVGTVQAKPSIRDGEVFVDAIEGTASAATKKQHAAPLATLTLPKDTAAAGSKSPRRRECATAAQEPVKSSDLGTPVKPDIKKSAQLPPLETAIVTLPSSSITETTPQKKSKASPSPSTPKSIPLPSMKTEMKQEETVVIEDISSVGKVTEPVKVSTPKKSEIKSDEVKKEVDAEVPAKESTPKKEITKESTPKKEIVKEPTPKKEIAKDVTPKKEIAKDVTPKKEPVKDAVPKSEAVKDVTPKKEPTGEIAVKNEALKDLSNIEKEAAIGDTPKRNVAVKKETEKTPAKETSTPKGDSSAVKKSTKKPVEQAAMEIGQFQPIKDLGNLENIEKPTVLVATETEPDIETPTKKAGRGRKPTSAKKKEPEIKNPEAVVEPESNAEVKPQEELKADVETSNIEKEEDKYEVSMESPEETPKKSLKKTPAKAAATPKSTRKTPTGKKSSVDETETPTPSKSTRKRRAAATEDGEETETPSKRTLRSRK